MSSPAASPVVAGVYARKSKYAEASESVSTQVALCRDLAQRQYPGCTFVVYDEDEGFSGKNTNRPGFLRMMEDVRSQHINVLYVYRLDRMGRSVRDICATLETLQRHAVSFVSVRENFDTSTPMGRAMLYVASVFAQLERETLAERVRDAVHAMARQGRWLGGNTPTGFVSRKDSKGWYYLEPVPDDLDKVRHLYEQFVSLGSVSALVTYCLRNGIRSRTGVEYSRTTLRSLLVNPVYCTADLDAFRFFSSHDYALAAELSEFDGFLGLQPFGRTSRNENTVILNPTSQWIIAVGNHPGAVPGAVWVRAQNILEQNKELGASFRGRRTENALLSGVIRCGSCGSAMRPKTYGTPLPDGSRRVAYICTRKVDSRGDLCTIKNAPANDVDAIVLDHLRQLSQQFDSLNQSGVSLLAASSAHAAEEGIRALQLEVQKAQQQMDNLTDTLAEGVPAAARQQIYQRMEDLSQLISEKEEAIAELTASQLDSQQQLSFAEQACALFASFGDGFSSLTHDEKRRLIRSVVSSVIWDGENITINPAGVPASLG